MNVLLELHARHEFMKHCSELTKVRFHRIINIRIISKRTIFVSARARGSNNATQLYGERHASTDSNSQQSDISRVYVPFMA